MSPLRVLDLFSGIGAYALGLERAGMKVVAFCECEEYPRRILRKHWPEVPIYEDVRTLTADTLRRDGIAVDVICGGWPCQGNSPAGTGLGMDDPRSGLWSEIARLVGELAAAGKPVRFLILENSSNLLAINGGADFGRVLGGLAALGYDAEWHCLSAAAFDAPHIRDRLWIVAHWRGASADVADANRSGRARSRQAQSKERRRHPVFVGPGPCASAADAADADRARLQGHAGHVADGRKPGRINTGSDGHAATRDLRGPLAYPHGFPSFGAAIARQERHTWEPEPDVGRVDVRAPDTVDRIHALGNCNPPIVPEMIGRAILAASATP